MRGKKVSKIFMSAMAYDRGESGISDYMNNVVLELAKKNEIDVLLLKSDMKKFPKAKNINLFSVSDNLAKPLINMFWHLFILPFILNFKKYDLAFLPAGNRRLFCYYPIFTIVTFHDLSQFHIKAKYDKFRMFYIRHIIPFFLQRVHKIIAVSEATKQDIIKFYGIDAQKIAVAYNGFDPKKFNSEPAPESRKNILASEKNYLLYVSRIEHPGKNHLNLIKAYEQLPASLQEKYDLVCAGGFKEKSEVVREYAERSKLKNNIKLTGFFPAENITSLYKNASLFVFPSLYEGFGIPLIEAMACKIPVVCSDRGPLPEVAGDAALLFDPENPQSIKEKMQLVLENDALRKELVDKGSERIKKFSWSLHAEKIMRLYREFNEKDKYI